MGVHLPPAIFAFAAGAHAGDQDKVSGLECRHCCSNLLDDADAFMAENSAGLAGRDIPP
jgi:hypothetical protein